MNPIRVLAASFMLLGCASAHAQMPPGIGVTVTVEGPVFVNSEGMALYVGPGRACNGEHRANIKPSGNAGANRKSAVSVELPLSCVQKNPPLLAAASSSPIGRWTLQRRDDGSEQWAYDGQPLHTSIKDRAAGEINGSYRVRLGSSEANASPAAQAPMPGLPAGLTVRETVAGLVFASHNGKTLYSPTTNIECKGACTQLWQPLNAPALANTAGLASEWSIVTRPGGAKQWAHRGGPLFTYAYDTEAHGGQMLGDTFGSIWGPSIAGWQIAIAKAAPRHPAGITVQQLPGSWEQFNTPLPATVYADSKGRTLYTMHCRQGELTCDDVGDDSRYWLSFCGGEERCAKTWRALPAPADATAIDGIWSVVAIDPNQPFKKVNGSEGVSVWAYRGRPVFTYARDTLPGDFYGDDQSFAITGDGMQARPIAAYARSGEARPPIVVLSDTTKVH
jgi:predicted lipoprotein with Yx(FWY)xxD motif